MTVINSRINRQATRLSKILTELKNLKNRIATLEQERDSIYSEWSANKVSTIDSKKFRFIKRKDSNKRIITNYQGLFNALKESHGDLVYGLIKFNFDDLDRYIPPDTIKPFVEINTVPSSMYIAELIGT